MVKGISIQNKTLASFIVNSATISYQDNIFYICQKYRHGVNENTILLNSKVFCQQPCYFFQCHHIFGVSRTPKLFPIHGCLYSSCVCVFLIRKNCIEDFISSIQKNYIDTVYKFDFIVRFNLKLHLYFQKLYCNNSQKENINCNVFV